MCFPIEHNKYIFNNHFVVNSVRLKKHILGHKKMALRHVTFYPLFVFMFQCILCHGSVLQKDLISGSYHCLLLRSLRATERPYDTMIHIPKSLPPPTPTPSNPLPFPPLTSVHLRQWHNHINRDATPYRTQIYYAYNI